MKLKYLEGIQILLVYSKRYYSDFPWVNIIFDSDLSNVGR